MSEAAGKASRRRFLTMVGAAGASAALLQVMTGTAPVSAAPGWTGRQQLPPGSGSGKSVLILGAGIAGLTAAYELHRAGYECVILEAQQRAGGRNLTARRGDVVTELTGNGMVSQECRFDEGLYLNLGPGRLPHHHRRVLRYCRELGVALEPYIAETTANLVQTPSGFGGAPRTVRQVANDTRGRIAELLAKAINDGALVDELTGEDRNTALSLLRAFGSLDVDHAYGGSTRSGCAEPLTVHDRCEAPTPLAFEDLLDSRFWTTNFYQPIEHLWQATMFQPVGGMDMIVKGFVRKIGHLIRYGAPVTAIEIADDSVAVTWQEGDSTFTRRADYCVSNIPLPVLRNIPANFSADFSEAVNFVRFEPTCKVGWQANSRFWESDRYQTYGGISRIDHNITQVWYPSYDYFTSKGTMTGAYNYETNAIELGEMTPADRLKLAKEGAALLHPEFADEAIVPTELGLSIAWQHVPYQLGGWAHWRDDEAHRKAYSRLLVPDRHFHVVGDQVSPVDGWQEGAMMSAEHVVNQVAGLVPITEATVAHAPDSRSLTQGDAAPPS
jgi:monoamine oxidase